MKSARFFSQSIGTRCWNLDLSIQAIRINVNRKSLIICLSIKYDRKKNCIFFQIQDHTSLYVARLYEKIL